MTTHEPALTSDEESIHAGCTCGWTADDSWPNDVDGVRAADLDFEAHKNLEESRLGAEPPTERVPHQPGRLDYAQPPARGTGLGGLLEDFRRDRVAAVTPDSPAQAEDLAERLAAADPAELGQRIRRARLKIDITQRQLGGDDASVSYVSRIEAGKRRPDLHLLEALAGRLRTTALALLTGATDPLAEAIVNDSARWYLKTLLSDMRQRVGQSVVDGEPDEYRSDAIYVCGALEGIVGIIGITAL